MGGVIIWLTVVILTVVFYVLHVGADGFWSKMNFLSRSQTWLPLAFLVVAALVGMADDLMGIFRRRGFSIKARLVLFSALAAVGGWWFVAKLGRDAVNIPFLGDITIGAGWYFLFFIAVMVALPGATALTRPVALTVAIALAEELKE